MEGEGAVGLLGDCDVRDCGIDTPNAVLLAVVEAQAFDLVEDDLARHEYTA